jgi:hypothetical protein
MTKCYDFDMLVLHDSSGQCPRYTGGECHPVPVPDPPTNDEERSAVASYEAWKKWASGDKTALDGVTPVTAKGVTRDPVTGELVDSVDPRRFHINPETGERYLDPEVIIVAVMNDVEDPNRVE